MSKNRSRQKRKVENPVVAVERMGSLANFRRMATVIQDSNDAITFQDLEGNILAWNRGAEIIYGYSQAEALRMNIVDTVPTEYQEEARGFLISLKRGELLPNLETKRKHKDGRSVDVWLTNTKLTDDKGVLTGIATTERDITEQTKTLEKFRRMATVIQDSNDAITFQDLDGSILAWNRGAEIMYGYSEAEALRMNIVDTVPTEYQEEARGFLASLKRGELVPNLETKRKTKDGRIIDVWLTNTKLTDEKGKLTGIATTERDISERKQSEAFLREKFRELEYLREGQIALSEKMRGEQIISRLGQSILSHLVPFTNAQIGAFYRVTEEKKLQRVSCYALPKIEGFEKCIDFGEGLIGQAALDQKSFLIDDVPADYFSKIESALGSIIPSSILICPILHEGEVNGVIELGSLRPFTEHQRVFLDHVSENMGIAINTSEVRKEIQKQNEALNKAQVLLEEKANEVQRASQYKTEFLANMSHELRTPLNSSLILAKLLMENARQNLTEEQIQFASSIYSSGHDLLNLINDILDLSKVEAGKLDIREEKVVVPKVLEGLEQTFRSLAKEKNIGLELRLEADVPQYFITDRQRLDQILKNLVSNALKFTEKGSVTIRVYSHSKRVLAFEVTDTGIGIPTDQQTIIFEAFRQADGTTNRKYGGTGLGLSISKELAKLLGGSIFVNSEAGQGSRFTLLLPETMDESLIIKDFAVKPFFRKGAIDQKYFEKYHPALFEDDRATLTLMDQTVLLIEDDVQFAKIVLNLAHELKYKCIIAQSADEGYEMALEYNPTSIMIDVKLPDHSGLTVLDRLKVNSKTRHMPVQVMSSANFEKSSLDMGALSFMLKPLSSQEVKNSMQDLQSRSLKIDYNILIFEKNANHSAVISEFISNEHIKVIEVDSVELAHEALSTNRFDCIIFGSPEVELLGDEIWEYIAHSKSSSTPPLIVFTEKQLSPVQIERLSNLPNSFVIKHAKSLDKLLHYVTLFLHIDERKLSLAHQQILKTLRSRDQVLEGRTVLLVDDDIRNIFALTSALEHKGATVIICRNGQEALDTLNQDPQVDLVLMDVMMPEMDGYEATRGIRKQKRFSELPIIAVTAKAMKDDQEKCLEAGTNDYVSKPVDLENLFSLMRVWLPPVEADLI